MARHARLPETPLRRPGPGGLKRAAVGPKGRALTRVGACAHGLVRLPLSTPKSGCLSSPPWVALQQIPLSTPAGTSQYPHARIASRRTPPLPAPLLAASRPRCCSARRADAPQRAPRTGGRLDPAAFSMAPCEASDNRGGAALLSKGAIALSLRGTERASEREREKLLKPEALQAPSVCQSEAGGPLP